MSPDEAKAALGSVEDTRLKMAARMHWPLWRHALAGLYLAVLLGAIVLDNTTRMILIALAVVGLAFVVREDKKRYGMFVSGYQRGRTIWVILANAAVFIAALLAMNSWVENGVSDPLFWVLTGTVFLVSTALSYIWEVVYRADLRREP